MALLPDDPKRRNALLGAGLALTALYFFHAYYYSPRAEEAQGLEARLEQLENQNRRAQIIATRGGAELEQRLALYEGHIIQLEKLIPQNEEVAALLEAMSLQGRRTGVEITLMRPEPMEVGDHYDRWSYELGVQGTYHSVGTFLASIASLERIVASVDMQLGPAPVSTETGKKAAEGRVNARFRIQTYVVSDREVRTPQQTQAGA
ncbi:MAG: type 4a pilus biogenesis protein PilO [Gemmatimonadota bacterium]|nr:type 4a pilus biogenesis protein PilO [Gemmatimonadota bacterium]